MHCSTEMWPCKYQTVSTFWRKETCAQISEEKGYEIIHSSDNYDVIAGQATIAYEMMKEQSLHNLDAILVPVSGGGMCSGIALAAKKINPSTKIIAIEPKGKGLGPCLKALIAT